MFSIAFSVSTGVNPDRERVNSTTHKQWAKIAGQESEREQLAVVVEFLW